MARTACISAVLVLFVGAAVAMNIGYGIQGRQTVCGLPQDPGPCNAFFPRWYFNTTNNACQKFVYGGCLGNANNFPDFSSCFLNCGGDVRCWLPSDSGPCLANFPRYYYNIFAQSCQEFTYGGCLGNANRFSDIDTCEFQCGDGFLGNRGSNRNRIQNRNGMTSQNRSGNQKGNRMQNRSGYQSGNRGKMISRDGQH